MSIATKRKHVTREVTDDLLLPETNQQIVKILSGRGNNLHEVEDENGDTFLVSMPNKVCLIDTYVFGMIIRLCLVFVL